MKTICVHHYSRARPENGKKNVFVKKKVRPLKCLLCGDIKK